MYRHLFLLENLFNNMLNYHLTCSGPTPKDCNLPYQNIFNDRLSSKITSTRIELKDSIIGSFKTKKLNVVMSFERSVTTAGNKLKTANDIYDLITNMARLDELNLINVDDVEEDQLIRKYIRDLNFKNIDYNLISQNRNLLTDIPNFRDRSDKTRNQLISTACETILYMIFDTHVDEMINYLFDNTTTMSKFFNDYFRCVKNVNIEINNIYKIIKIMDNGNVTIQGISGIKQINKNNIVMKNVINFKTIDPSEPEPDKETPFRSIEIFKKNITTKQIDNTSNIVPDTLLYYKSGSLITLFSGKYDYFPNIVKANTINNIKLDQLDIDIDIVQCNGTFWQYYFILGDYLLFNTINKLNQSVNKILRYKTYQDGLNEEISKETEQKLRDMKSISISHQHYVDLSDVKNNLVKSFNPRIMSVDSFKF